MANNDNNRSMIARPLRRRSVEKQSKITYPYFSQPARLSSYVSRSSEAVSFTSLDFHDMTGGSLRVATPTGFVSGGGGKFTYNTWIYLRAFPTSYANPPPLGRHTTSGYNRLWSFQVSGLSETNALLFSVGTGPFSVNTAGTGGVLSYDNNWHMLTVVYDSSKSLSYPGHLDWAVKIYVDGVQKSVTGATALLPPASSDYFYIGPSNATKCWHIINHTAYFANIALTDDEILDMYNGGIPTDLTDEEGLALYIKTGDGQTIPEFDAYSTPIMITDFSPLGNDMTTIAGGPGDLNHWRFKNISPPETEVGRQLDLRVFGLNSNWLEKASPVDVPYGTTPLTAAVWYRVTAGTGLAGVFMGWLGQGQNSWKFHAGDEVGTRRLYFTTYSGASTKIARSDAQFTASTNEWMLLGVTYDPSEADDTLRVKLYKNGENITWYAGSDSYSTLQAATTSDILTIGSGSGAVIEYSNFAINHSYLFDRILTDSEMALLYNRGTALEVGSTGSNLVMYCRAGEDEDPPLNVTWDAWSQVIDFTDFSTSGSNQLRARTTATGSLDYSDNHREAPLNLFPE